MNWYSFALGVLFGISVGMFIAIFLHEAHCYYRKCFEENHK